MSAEMDRLIDKAFAEGIKLGRLEERTAVVLYLHRKPDVLATWNAGVAIERGLHLECAEQA